jgi:hypothetical protein
MNAGPAAYADPQAESCIAIATSNSLPLVLVIVVVSPFEGDIATSGFICRKSAK